MKNNFLKISVMTALLPQLLYAAYGELKFECRVKNDPQVKALQLSVWKGNQVNDAGYQITFLDQNNNSEDVSYSFQTALDEHAFKVQDVNDLNRQQLRKFEIMSQDDENLAVGNKVKLQNHPAVPVFIARFDLHRAERNAAPTELKVGVDKNLNIKMACVPTANAVDNYGDQKANGAAYEAPKKGKVVITANKVTREMWCLKQDMVGTIDLRDVKLDPKYEQVVEVKQSNDEPQEKIKEVLVDQNFLKKQYQVECQAR